MLRRRITRAVVHPIGPASLFPAGGPGGAGGLDVVGYFNIIPPQSISAINTDTLFSVPIGPTAPGSATAVNSNPSKTSSGSFAYVIAEAKRLASPPLSASDDVPYYGFKVRYRGILHPPSGGCTFTNKLYLVNESTLVAQAFTTLGNDNLLVTFTTTGSLMGANSFNLEIHLSWNEASHNMSGWHLGTAYDGSLVAPTTIAAVSGLNFDDINLMPTFQASAVGASVQLSEFSLKFD